MCHCSRDSQDIAIPGASGLDLCSQNLIDLFQNDVLVLLISENGVVFDRASSSAVKREFSQQISTMKQLIEKAENAIRHTLDSSRTGTKIQCFRLNCHSSRIHVAILSELYRLVIINRGWEERGMRDSADFDQNLNQICEQLKSSIHGEQNAHVRE
jgi:hypothetical protein